MRVSAFKGYMALCSDESARFIAGIRGLLDGIDLAEDVHVRLDRRHTEKILRDMLDDLNLAALAREILEEA